jgi:hypothetical protein
MQNLLHAYILLNGAPKTLLIESITMETAGVYCVQFKGSQSCYRYKASSVVWMKDAQSLQPELVQIYACGVLQKHLSKILRFEHDGKAYWRLVFDNEIAKDYVDRQITIKTSCLNTEQSSITLDYMRRVADINPLYSEDGEGSILSKIYNRLAFVDAMTAAACYLNPEKFPIKKSRCYTDLIYPFGCNASQKLAVAAAFENQISVIQGPPGTGKTQTILNIIANIVKEGKTVMVVSNNNSATANVREKLETYGLDFMVASLGSKENKESFLQEQKPIPAEIRTCSGARSDRSAEPHELKSILQHLDTVYALQNQQAQLRHDRGAIEMEWRHFCAEMGIAECAEPHRILSAARFIKFWTKLERDLESGGGKFSSVFRRLWALLKQWWRLFYCRYVLRLHTRYTPGNTEAVIRELKLLFYQNRLREVDAQLLSVEQQLQTFDADALSASLRELSMARFKQELSIHYQHADDLERSEVNDIYLHPAEFLARYPVVLSTTFSARTCLFADTLYDYIIMDEASQVSIEMGVLALTCAKNAVIVGDIQQLPNVVTDEERQQLSSLRELYPIADGYDCAKYNFLKSVCGVIPTVTQTMLREHYRCHPRIIDFCNQKFYGGNLLIMTQDKGEPDVLRAVKTVPGNHAVNQFNQREIDVVREEVLPWMADSADIGVVTPYKNQVAAFLQELPQLDAATIHKFQGREKYAIIMSVVDNQISPFADDANLLNVAVSRAKKQFCLVITGNEQEKPGNLTDLLDYINYANCSVTDSRVSSIFDYLYAQYAEQRMEWLKKQPKMSDYASELLTNALLQDILASELEFAGLGFQPHIPVSDIIKDTSRLNDEERLYVSRSGTHVDFMIYKQVSHKPILAIETDGYAYHHDQTIQHARDLKKDHIFQLYGIPLLRLSTRGSGERERVISQLKTVLEV